MVADITNISSITQPGAIEFALALPDADALTCQEVVRVIPKRRLVCKGVWNGRAVFAKIFTGSTAATYANRDKAGVKALLAANIETPELLYEKVISSNLSVLIFSAIAPAENAEYVWRQQQTSRLGLLKALVTTIARHHRAGLIQTDLHLKNFLVQIQTGGELRIYTLDGDGIRPLRCVLGKSQRLANLSTLFSKFDVLDDVSMPELYQHYCSEMAQPYSVHAATQLAVLTQKIRHKVAGTYADKKVFRNCTDVKVEKTFTHYQALASKFLIDYQTLSAMDVFLADAQANFKNGNTCTVAKAELAGQQVVIKRYNIKNFWHGLSRALRPSRAAVSWANAHRLLISNIATPAPLALFEQRFGCLRGKAYFVTAYADAPDVAQFYAQNLPVQAQSAVAHNLAQLFFKLYSLKYSHGDCKASNIKIVDLQPMLIDLDSMQAHPVCVASHWRFERKHMKDLKRLMQNWQHDVATTALLKLAFQSVYTNAAKAILIRAGIV